jgi:hypothetical protein
MEAETHGEITEMTHETYAQLQIDSAREYQSRQRAEELAAIRREMATHILAGMMSENPTGALPHTNLAQLAVLQADALIEELNK